MHPIGPIKCPNSRLLFRHMPALAWPVLLVCLNLGLPGVLIVSQTRPTWWFLFGTCPPSALSMCQPRTARWPFVLACTHPTKLPSVFGACQLRSICTLFFWCMPTDLGLSDAFGACQHTTVWCSFALVLTYHLYCLVLWAHTKWDWPGALLFWHTPSHSGSPSAFAHIKLGPLSAIWMQNSEVSTQESECRVTSTVSGQAETTNTEPAVSPNSLLKLASLTPPSACFTDSWN